MVHFENNLGFPLTTNILEQMQTDREVCSRAVAGLLPNGATNGIISGCEVINNVGFGGANQVADGVVVIDGELMAFKGGTASPNAKVYVITETISDEFENGTTSPVITRKYATIGISPEGTPWESFKNTRVFSEVQHQMNHFGGLIVQLSERIDKMLPIGTIAIWGKPATEPIPEGWQECTDLRGRMPVGWNPEDSFFNQIGKVGGAKTHTLTEEEMPSHNHQQGGESLHSVYGGGESVGNRTYPQGAEPSLKKQNTSSVGGNQPHNNMPPYRVVQFIEFVGFN